MGHAAAAVLLEGKEISSAVLFGARDTSTGKEIPPAVPFGARNTSTGSSDDEPSSSGSESSMAAFEESSLATVVFDGDIVVDGANVEVAVGAGVAFFRDSISSSVRQLLLLNLQ